MPPNESVTLRALRKQHGWDLKAASRATGIHWKTIMAYEHGRLIPRLLTATYLASIYGVSLEQFKDAVLETLAEKE